MMNCYKYLLMFCLLFFYSSYIEAKENDMVIGALENNVSIMERGYITGVSLNVRDKKGDPVLIIASRAGHVEAVKYLAYLLHLD